MDALIGCQFEETQQGHDEAVRARIMQVMVGCLEGGAGTWLPDEVVWEVLQTCMANLDQMVRGLDRGQSGVHYSVGSSGWGLVIVAATVATCCCMDSANCLATKIGSSAAGCQSSAVFAHSLFLSCV